MLRAAPAWSLGCLGLAVAAIVAWRLDANAIDWQPALIRAEPWRLWTAAFVHLSGLHLGANLAGAAVVAGFGMAARVRAGAALAWFVTWPLTHLMLLLQPGLTHYAGLSGVLHAGVAIVATTLWLEADRRPAQRVIGAGILLALALKIALEAPWSHVLIHPAGWDIAVAPLAHAAGSLCGMAAALLLRFTAPR